jgi:preprotein translocase subunit SecG
MDVLKIVLTVVQMLVALALIGIVMSQATKSEGLTGTIGGKSESAFRGKPGTEEKLGEITKWAAIAFMVTSALVGYLHAV